MPKIVIDHQEIEVPRGTKVIEAAERLGIKIPRFCYHKALGSVGACRVCAVKFVEGPVKGIKMSCMEDARDGMVVSTTDPEAREFRKYVIEWLMLHHPLDCPVCDEGGHCLLQDQTIAGGHGTRRYMGKKRTYYDQYLGPFVQHEMNRCIHCFRCRRFYQEFAGYRDLGAMQIGNRMYFGRYEDGMLESPFAGNLIDICPTGVYTDRPARFKGQRWDFERAPSLCLHCSLGCNTTGSARYREMIRQEARINESVNGSFICDRGRFGFDFTNHPDRPRKSRVGDKEVSWEEGIEAAASELKRIISERGPDSIACLGSSRCSLETQASLKRLCRELGWPPPSFFVDPLTARKVRSAVLALDEELVASLREVEAADFILAVGADPVNEAPMLALAMRQAYRDGASVAVIDPRPISLPFSFSHLPVTPESLVLCTGVITRLALDARGAENLDEETALESLPGVFAEPDMEDRLRHLAESLKRSTRPFIVCGTDIVREDTPSAIAGLARLLRRYIEGARLFYLLQGPNAFGAGLLSSEEAGGSILDGIESGRIRALVLVEQDPFFLWPDHPRLEKAFDRLDLLLTLDYLPSPSIRKAHMVLPTSTVFEGSASRFINQEGRVQKATPVHRGGVPLSQISHGTHPPRTFLSLVPGGDPRPGHEAVDGLYAALSGKEKGSLQNNLLNWLVRDSGVFADGVRLAVGRPQGQKVSPLVFHEPPPGEAGMELLLTEWTFGTEELSSYSRHSQKAETVPRLFMHPEDAARLALSDGDRVSLSLEGGELTLELCLQPAMAQGLLIAPKHRNLNWHLILKWPVRLQDGEIRRISG